MEKPQHEPHENFSLEEAEHELASAKPQSVFGVGFGVKAPSHRFRPRLPFLRSKKFWLIFSSATLAVAAGAWLLLPVRFWILNTAGFKAGLVVSVRDAKSGAAVEEAEVSIDGHDYISKKDKSGQNAIVTIRDISFGKHTLTVGKPGYTPKDQNMTISQFGSRVTAQTKPVLVSIEPTGLPVTVNVQHWLSKKPLPNIKVEFASLSATTDAHGQAILTLPPTGQKEVDVTLSGEGFITQKAKARVGKGEELSVSLVDAAKHYFISKRTGTFGIYSSNADGTNATQLIAGTGKEADGTNLEFVISGNNQQAAYISTRDGTRNARGQQLKQLYVVDLEKGTLTKIDEAPDLTITAWADTSTFVYSRGVYDVNNGQFKYREVLSYATTSKEKKTLAQANSFFVTDVAEGKVFIAPNASELNAGLKNSQASLFSITPDERQKITIENQETQRVARTAWQTLTYLTNNDSWHEFDLKSSTKKDLFGEPTTVEPMTFDLSANGKRIVWVAQRDGKGALVLSDAANNAAEKILHKADGVVKPARWLTDKLVVFRIKNSQETADYIMSTDGGAPHKIADVAGVGSGN